VTIREGKDLAQLDLPTLTSVVEKASKRRLGQDLASSQGRRRE
jgi:hypothetical protein